MPPTFIVYDATFVSVASLALTSWPKRIISVNGVPCGASAFALSVPVSSGGNSPFGMFVHTKYVATSTSAEKASVTGRCDITQSRLRS